MKQYQCPLFEDCDIYFNFITQMFEVISKDGKVLHHHPELYLCAQGYEKKLEAAE
jgi:hypothetical protein